MGDRVLFLDCDIVLFDGFPFDQLLQHDLALTEVPMHHDVTREMPLVNRILGVHAHIKYLASPIVFKVDNSAHEFFDLWRSMRPLSKKYGKGTMFALNLACYHRPSMDDVYILPADRCAYTLTVRFNEKIKNPVLFHYGGAQGKQIWMDEYKDGKTYNYRA
jgi:hypothetical protein